MRYTPPAIEHRLVINAQLGTPLPSQGGGAQPVWRQAKPEKPREQG
jgi:hypothetical protein